MIRNSKTSKIVTSIAGASIALALVLAGAVSAGAQTYTFSKDLVVGSTSQDIKNLQKLLNMSADTQVAVSGAGSPGNETTYFGARTKAAIAKFQVKNGIIPTLTSPGSGRVGPLTRGFLNTWVAGNPNPNPTNPNPTPGVGSLSVSAAAQPIASLAPASASRVPFTKVTLTAGSADVTVNSITVERAGLAQDAVFSGIVLLDENGQQIGISKTLNSNHQAAIGEPMVVRAGTSRTVTIAGNMSSSLSSYAGQVAGINVVSVNLASGTANGSFPITGAFHTINASLSLGSTQLAVSSLDPNSSATKEIGTSNYKFAGVRVTAGSVEKVRLWSVRFNQTGSASSNDLSNVMVNVDGTDYPTTVSSDGKYFSALFAGGILIDKGFSKEIYIKGDVIGSGAAGRTVKFDIYKNTDVYITGETYNYGIIATPSSTGSASNSTSEFTTGTPFFDGSLVTISAGSATTIAKANSVVAQNIAVNVPGQILGGFETNFKGEPVSVQTTVFTVASSSGTISGSGGVLLTNVSIYDQNGAQVAGPVDATYTNATTQTLTFTDTITFPVGKMTYTLKGKVGSAVGNGTLYTVSTTPSGWTNVTGQITGNTITISQGAFSMNQMTVKSAALSVAVSASPSAQTVVAGSQNVVFANFQFDASQSGEDVRFSSIPVTLTVASGAATDLTNCQIWDGSTSLTTGSNVVNPSAAGTQTFTLDQTLTIPKQSVKTISLSCTVGSGATGSYRFGNTSGNISSLTVTGVTSSNSVTPSGTASLGQLQTTGSASLTVAADSSSPSYKVTAAGSTGVTLGVLKFTAVNDSINLDKIGLVLSNTASSSPSNLTMVTLWDGSTQVGSAQFVGSNTTATSTLTSTVTIPKGTDKTITIKGDLAAITNPGGTGTGDGTEGALIVVNNNATSDVGGTRGTGVGSGTTINATGSTSFDGVRVFKSYPTFAQDTLSSTGVSDGKLLRFKVTANAGSLSISKFTLSIATTSGVSVTGINIFGYEDASYSQPVSGVQGSGALAFTNLAPAANLTAAQQDVFVETSANASTTLVIPQGATRYFEVRANSISGLTTGSSVTTSLLGDSQYPILASLMGTATAINSQATGFNNFVWSPNATTTSALAHTDWTNGYNIPGLPSSGIVQSRGI